MDSRVLLILLGIQVFKGLWKLHNLHLPIIRAEHLGVSVSTVEGKWTHARAWLRRDLSEGTPT